MNDITTHTIDKQVQATLKDWRVSPWKRAHIAIEMIEEHVRAEHGLTLDEFLPVPIEWEHRVAGMAEQVVVHPTGHAEIVMVEVSPGAYMDVFDDVDVLEGEVVSDSALEDMKAAFDAEWDGDEEEAQKRFDKFWKWGRD